MDAILLEFANLLGETDEKLEVVFTATVVDPTAKCRPLDVRRLLEKCQTKATVRFELHQ
jgi:hypothetical protein